MFLLLNAGTVVSTDRIVDALWGDAPPASAAKLVQHYVSQLRQQARPRGDRLRFRPATAHEIAAGSLDSLRFEQLLREGREARQAGNPQLGGCGSGPSARSLARRGAQRRLARRLCHLRCRSARRGCGSTAPKSSSQPSSSSGSTRRYSARRLRLAAEHPHRERIRGRPHGRALPRGPSGRGARGLPHCPQEPFGRARSRAR